MGACATAEDAEVVVDSITRAAGLPALLRGCPNRWSSPSTNVQDRVEANAIRLSPKGEGTGEGSPKARGEHRHPHSGPLPLAEG